MSLVADFGLHQSTLLGSLQRECSTVPSGVAEQFAEVATTLAEFDDQASAVRRDANLSPVGRATKIGAAREAAHTAIETWRAGKVDGIEKQIAALRTSLLADADKGLPTPTDLQISHMVARLSAFDPLDIEVLYAEATDAERKVMESAVHAVGRQPVRRGERVVWEPLLASERITAAVAARAEQTNPQGAAHLRDLQHIRGAYDAIAGAAKGLARDAAPR